MECIITNDVNNNIAVANITACRLNTFADDLERKYPELPERNKRFFAALIADLRQPYACVSRTLENIASGVFEVEGYHSRTLWDGLDDVRTREFGKVWYLMGQLETFIMAWERVERHYRKA